MPKPVVKVNDVATGRQANVAGRVASPLGGLERGAVERGEAARARDRRADQRARLVDVGPRISTTPVALTARASGGKAGLTGVSACAAALGCGHVMLCTAPKPVGVMIGRVRVPKSSTSVRCSRSALCASSGEAGWAGSRPTAR